mgnify:CR=1 FL=1
MHTLLDDYITGMGFVGIEPGVLYHLAPVTQGVETVLSGTGSVALENVVGDWVDLSIHGRSDQQTTTGAQIVNLETSDINEYIEIIDEIITLKSGATGRFNYFEIPEITLEPGTYTMHIVNVDGMKNDGNLQITFRLKTTNINTDNTVASTNWYVGGNVQGTNGIGTTEITDKMTVKYLDVDIVKGDFAGQRFKIMLNVGSAAMPWEPYTGNQPSPNPDYLQEIKKSGEKTAQLWEGGRFECSAGGSSSGFMKAPQNVTDAIKLLPDGVYTITYTPHGDGTIGSAAGKVSFLNAESQHILSSVNTFEMTEDFRAGIASVALYGYLNGVNVVDDFMLNEGSTALPWEPYGLKIETTIDNAGYLERGSRSDLVKMIPLEKGHKYRLFSTDKNSNKNTFVFADQNLTFAGGNALYSYGINKGYVNTNGTGIVSGECRLKGAWNPAVEFTATEDGLYLYYGLNSSGLSDDEVWVWTGDGYLTDTPYQKQTITTYTPNGLPGIPVTSGGNYTDETGQQWITDEIDFGRGKYIQRVAHYAFDGSEMWRADGATQEDGYTCYYYQDTSVSDARKSMCSHAVFANKGSVDDNWDNGKYISAGNLAFEVRTKMTLDEWKNYLSENHVEYYAMLKTPVETDLSAAEIEAYKALHTYKPATIITANGGEVESGITGKYQEGE